ncbi:DUF2520 domain-containing protein [uncultured Paludibaculum sp.]|uniref:DUF2520 domain-containing protein n=1 Tax=uncultured Paludibaculum sp. TaxID=1765020 RepID=UPI002AABCE97|nr:DUF2520 domain-containing protein [uncultured Paludibaculum sp.]
MNKLLPVGLIASGRMTESLLIRYPLLTRDFGPVVASSRRLASRYANALKAGHAAEVKELGQCRLVLIQAPALELSGIVSTLTSSPISWKSKVVALLDDDLDATELQPLHERRAAVGSVALAPMRDRGRLVVEGDTAAVRLLHQWAAPARLECIELKARSKALYGAGLMAASSLFAPVLDCASRSLRAAGLTQVEARQMLTLLVELALRGQRVRSRKAWPGPASMWRRPSVLRHIRALAEVDRGLAAFYQRSLSAALDYEGQESGWLSEPLSPSRHGTD